MVRQIRGERARPAAETGSARDRRRGALLAAAAFAFSVPAALTGQSASQEERIRAPVWVYAEPVPGTAREAAATLPVRELTELSRFVLAGMIYGWKYEYRPSDKLRNVAEEFALRPIGAIEEGDPSFSLTGLTAEYPRLACWAQYAPNETTARWQRHWQGITVRTGKGTGRGERLDGTAGIRAAYEAALLNAVRERARKLEKNKPKEIRGEVLLRPEPRLYADAGQFVADVRVLVSIDELVPWTSF